MQEENERSNNQGTTINEPRKSEISNREVPNDRFVYLAKMNRTIEPKDWNDLEQIKNLQDKARWLEATVDPPLGKRVIGCKWIFTTKYNSKCEVEKYKAQLLAKGFYKKFGTDYDEIFAPVVTYTTLRSFLAYTPYKNLYENHIDIKTAFLHGNLDEDVYMSQPDRHIKPQAIKIKSAS